MLIHRVDYCGDYGAILSRFLVEAAIGYPLMVHGSAGQIAPSPNGGFGIFNRMTRTHPVIDLAKRISEMIGVKWRSKVCFPSVLFRQHSLTS